MGVASVTLRSHASHHPESIILISHLHQVSFLPSFPPSFCFRFSCLLPFSFLSFLSCPKRKPGRRRLWQAVFPEFSWGRSVLGLWTPWVPAAGASTDPSARAPWAPSWLPTSLGRTGDTDWPSFSGIPVLRVCLGGRQLARSEPANRFIIHAEPCFSLQVNFIRFF